MNPQAYVKRHGEILDLMHDTTIKKNADYSGDSGDAFHNFRMVEHLGIADAGTAIMVRMSDKMARISSFLQKGELKVSDETVMDTCIDLANYAVILALYFEQRKSSSTAVEVSTVKK